MKKWKIVSLIMLMIFCLSGCGTAKTDEKQPETNIQVHKDGKITQTIYENFRETYYHVDELEQFASDYIDDFNLDNPTSHIELKECEMDNKTDGVIRVVIEYDNAATYSKFNDVMLFVGTIEQAYDQGYDLNMYLESTNDKKAESIVKADLLKMGSKHILLSDENMTIGLYTDILYRTKETEMQNSKNVIMKQTQGTSAVVFK